MRRRQAARWHEALVSWMSIADICAGDWVDGVTYSLARRLAHKVRRGGWA